MPLIKTLSQALRMDKGTVQSSKIRSTGDSYPADLAGWNLSTGNEVFENISFYRYQLLHCE